MSLFPVAARSLHRRRVRLRDFVLERASVFPFFDREGRTRALMLVWPPARPIVVLEYPSVGPPWGERSELAKVRWWGEIQLDVEFAGLRDTSVAGLRNIDANRAASVAGVPPEAGKWGTWHYDPWWVLREPCFAGHPAVPALKATNCAGAFLKPIYGCFFSRDLSRFVGVTTKSRNHSGLSALDYTYRPFSPELLPEDRPRVRPRQPSGWSLDPFWLRAGWRPPARPPS